MADNSSQTGADTIRDKDRSGIKTQIFGIDVGIGTGTESLMSPTAPMPVQQVDSTTGTITSPALSLTSFTVLASNTARIYAMVYNETPNLVYLALASSASTTSYSLQLPSGAFFELTELYTGAITGIALVASGNLRVTELT